MKLFLLLIKLNKNNKYKFKSMTLIFKLDLCIEKNYKIRRIKNLK